MKKSNVIGLLFASAFVLAGTQLGTIQAEARPHDKKDKWESRWNNGRWGDWDDDDDDDDDDDRWEDKWDDDKWDDKWDDDDDDDDRPQHTYGGKVNVIYFCEEDNSVWANGEIWAKGLVDGKGNVNSSELTNIPAGYKLKVVGDFYYDGGKELRIQVVPEHTYGGKVNVIYFCEEDNSVWANGEIWAKGLVDGKGNVNSSELTNIPAGYKLKVVGDFYYDGGKELRIQVVPEHTYGGKVNVIYFCEEDNSVWANGEIWAKGLVDGKGNVNSSELTNIPAGYKLKVVGDFYFDGGKELRIQVVPEHTYGGKVNVIYFCEETNSVWANGEIWAKGLVDGKGNVNSSELTNVPAGYKLKVVGDFYFDGGKELRIQVVPK